MAWQQILLLVLTGHAAGSTSGILALLIKKGNPVKLLVDLEKDIELIKARYEDLVPDTAADVTALVRELAAKYVTTGVTRADVVTGLRQVAAELEAQAAADAAG
jgi:hypothetical protein